MAPPDSSSPRVPGPAQRVLPELTPLQATWRGTVTALVLVAPAAVLNTVLINSEDIEPGDPAAFFFWILILLGGAAGGWAVVRLAPSARLSHAAAAAAASYLVVQAIGVVLRLIDGEPISWLAFPFLATLMAICGMLGGMFARRWQLQNGPTEGTGRR